MDLKPGQQIVLSTDLEDGSVNCRSWDAKTGALITAFKGGNSAPKCFSVVGDDWVASAYVDKPILQLWTWHKSDRLERKIILPGLVSALAFSPSGDHCVAGIDQKIYIWLMSTGNLLSVLDFHSTKVMCVKFSEDGRYFVSAGTNDTRVFVWNFNKAVSSHDQQNCRPLQIFDDHKDAVTDVFITCAAVSSKVVSCGADGYCFVNEMLTGKRVFSVFSQVGFTSVTADAAMFFLYLGTENGKILQVKCHEYQRCKSVGDTIDKSSVKLWENAHGGFITCLSVSSNGKYLVSGSNDYAVKVWDTMFAKPLVTLPHKGSISNCVIIDAPYPLISSEKIEPTIQITTFKRSLQTDDAPDELLPAKLSTQLPLNFGVDPYEKLLDKACSKIVRPFTTENKGDIERELEEKNIANEQFYSFTLGTFMQSIQAYHPS